jgi:hypothetical protein
MFVICQKEYAALQDLLHQEEYEYVGDWKYPNCQMKIHRDIHGRRVLYLSERFPCFDSWDYLCEKRYYHWYFVAHEAGVAMVYTKDEWNEIEVVENIDTSYSRYTFLTREMRHEIEKSGMLK